MIFRYNFLIIIVTVSSFLLTACQNVKFENFKEKSASLVNSIKGPTIPDNSSMVSESQQSAKSLSEILTGSLAEENQGTDFLSVVSSALDKDPVVISKRRTVKAKLAAINSTEAQKEYQVSSTVYGGIEDISDNTRGIALGLDAKRLIFDGGQLDAIIAVKNFEAEAAQLNLKATVNERAYYLGGIWLEVEKYKKLQTQIDDRLAVLDPLIEQLEKVAEAGIGDVSKVAAAQRTVSGIRVTQTSISEGLAKAQLEFLNAFGSVDENISYDSRFISALLPDTVHVGLAQTSPLLNEVYANYKAALANLAAVSAKDDFNIGFEARALKPFAGSGYDSDESIGLVARKTLYSGGMLESEIGEAEAIAEAALSEVEATYRQGVSIIKSAKQSIESMDKAIELARANAKIASDEIVYLRQQLIIGGSTLDSVLSAEARLYEAESQEIAFIAEKRKSELLIASTLGLLGHAFDLSQ